MFAPKNHPSKLPLVPEKADGRCAICETTGPLTEDHVFPSSALENRKVEMRPVHELDARVLPARSQNGVRFKTICAYCNNTRLGHETDPYLADLVCRVRNWMNASTSALDRGRFDCENADKIALSVFGHLLAASVTYHPETAIDVAMRQSVLAGELLPGAPKVFYWLAKYSHPTVLRTMVTMRLGVGEQPVALALYKLPPVGFVVTHSEAFDGLPPLEAKAGFLRFWPQLARDDRWPEVAHDKAVGLGGDAVDGRRAVYID